MTYQKNLAGASNLDWIRYKLCWIFTYWVLFLLKCECKKHPLEAHWDHTHWQHQRFCVIPRIAQVDAGARTQSQVQNLKLGPGICLRFCMTFAPYNIVPEFWDTPTGYIYIIYIHTYYINSARGLASRPHMMAARIEYLMATINVGRSIRPGSMGLICVPMCPSI